MEINWKLTLYIIAMMFVYKVVSFFVDATGSAAMLYMLF